MTETMFSFLRTSIPLAAVMCFLISYKLRLTPAFRVRRLRVYMAFAVSTVIAFTASAVIFSLSERWFGEGYAAASLLYLIHPLATAAVVAVMYFPIRMLGYDAILPEIFASSVFLSAVSASICESLWDNAAGGAVFIALVLIFFGIISRTDNDECAESFRGIPSIMLSGAFLFLASEGFRGIAENLFT